MLKITSKQVERVHRLVKTCCANCDKDGNCTLLDDGEAHRCVQLISIYGIYCNYFPMHRQLLMQKKKSERIRQVRRKREIRRSLNWLPRILHTPTVLSHLWLNNHGIFTYIIIQ
ncbi:MAG: hypothetical protein E7270_11770 [Lachnospiraceae bacterium]|nr:hypothetical protein [Lachnospiraceae bacterium]